MNGTLHSITRPNTVALDDDGRALVVIWIGRPPVRIPAETLWAQCPSAAGRKRRMDGITGSGDPDLRLTHVRPIGNYAVNLSFSDGHDRGVYPWALLEKLAQRPSMAQFIAPSPQSSCAGQSARQEEGQVR